MGTRIEYYHDGYVSDMNKNFIEVRWVAQKHMALLVTSDDVTDINRLYLYLTKLWIPENNIIKKEAIE